MSKRQRTTGPLGKAAILMGLYLALSSCTTNPATGKRQFTPFMTPAQERQIGLQQHPQLLQQFGGAYDEPRLAAYVATVGGRMAKNSELANDDFTFTLLNSKVVNAFALPGGFVYMSRGLLGLMNDEAELASVLGHEVGHVTARHAANRYNRGIFSQVIGIGIGIATGSGEAAQLFMQGSQAWLLGYSREQEYQSDDLGVRYMTRAGYDPYGAPRMLAALGRESALQARILGKDEASRVPAWARTHPLTEDRVTRALANARAQKVAVNAAVRNRDAFLSAIDGMAYDDDPGQGVVRGQEFWHPKLGFTFRVPEGFVLQNGESSVLADGPGDAAILFAGAKIQAGTDMTAYIGQVWASLSQNQGPALSSIERLSVNGMDAATGVTRLASGGSPLDIRVVGMRLSEGSAFHFIFVSPAGETASFSEPYRRTTYSFRRLSAEEARSVRGRRLKVVTMRAGDSAAALAAKMAYDDYQLERFLVLNGLDDASSLRAGDKVKLVVLEGD
ncbi:MAG: M48 family metalloprotease [Pseudomonadota bacterium]